MIWYTMQPQEMMFPEEGMESLKQNVILYQNVPLVVQQKSPFEYEVVQVLSTDPSHFLKADCQPGSVISFLPDEQIH